MLRYKWIAQVEKLAEEEYNECSRIKQRVDRIIEGGYEVKRKELPKQIRDMIEDAESELRKSWLMEVKIHIVEGGIGPESMSMMPPVIQIITRAAGPELHIFIGKGVATKYLNLISRYVVYTDSAKRMLARVWSQRDKVMKMLREWLEDDYKHITDSLISKHKKGRLTTKTYRTKINELANKIMTDKKADLEDQWLYEGYAELKQPIDSWTPQYFVCAVLTKDSIVDFLDHIFREELK